MKTGENFFITTEKLSELLELSNVKIIDLREEENYLEGHIPNSINISSDVYIQKSPEGFNILPDKDVLEKTLRDKGINSSDTLIFVDDVFNLNCSLAAWVLYYFGFENLMLLDGALGKWKKEGRPLERDVPQYDKGDLKLDGANNEILITRDELLVSLQTKEYLIVDNRSEYALRLDNMGGTIPTAIHYWWMNAFEEYPDYFTLKPLEVIQSELNELGITKEKKIVLYCESAPESALIFFVLKQLTYPHVKLYLGGYEEWRLYCSFL